MSASSNWVTWGIMTQLRCRFGPDSFLMRDNSCSSTSPNLVKSTFGHGNKSRPTPLPPLDAPAEAEPTPATAAFTKLRTSSGVMRPLGPVPATVAKFTPNSRANLRTDGLACGALTDAAVGLCGSAAAGAEAAAGDVVGATFASTAGAAAAAGADSAFGASALGAGSDAAGAAAAPPAAGSRISIKVPSFTLSPIFTFISFTTPA